MSGQTPTTTITLSVRSVGAGASASLLYHVRRDGQVLAANQVLGPATVRALHELTRAYLSQFEGQHRPRVTTGRLQALGKVLFEMWLESVWPRATEGGPGGTQRALVVASDVPEVLNLPWELLRPSGGDALGLDPLFSVRRLPRVEGGWKRSLVRCHQDRCASCSWPAHRRIRTGSTSNARRGSSCVLSALASRSRWPIWAPSRSFRNVSPRFGHMSCTLPVMALFRRTDWLYFAFKNDAGRTDLCSSTKLRQRVLAGSGAQCVFVSGCQSGQAPPVAVLGGLCQGLVGSEVPLAIGWTASVDDTLATRFARTFYRTLAAGQSVDRALVLARQALHEVCHDASNGTDDPSWTLPVLYAATVQQLVVGRERSTTPLSRPSTIQPPSAARSRTRSAA